MNTNQFFEQQKYALKAQWRSMDMATKAFAVLVFALIIVGGLLSSLFIISTTLIVTGAFYLRQLWQRAFFSKPTERPVSDDSKPRLR